uniref:Uncharacterized protein n=1 Tax=Salmonella enteritidis TaxID=149539 RepID=T1PY01_SALEN|nr:hypothetical protein pS1400_89_0112 [Salmonella enterica subsp. enterica serovar Enteritidis]
MPQLYYIAIFLTELQCVSYTRDVLYQIKNNEL